MTNRRRAVWRGLLGTADCTLSVIGATDRHRHFSHHQQRGPGAAFPPGPHLAAWLIGGVFALAEP